ncbi:unnamed protein product [Prunus armeniaca]
MVKVCEACEGQDEEDDGAVTEPDLARVGKHRILDLPERSLLLISGFRVQYEIQRENGEFCEAAEGQDEEGNDAHIEALPFPFPEHRINDLPEPSSISEGKLPAAEGSKSAGSLEGYRKET